jgi:hypothetical protein
MECTGYVAHLEEINLNTISVGMLKGKTPFRRLKCKWDNDIKMDIKDVEEVG